MCKSSNTLIRSHFLTKHKDAAVAFLFAVSLAEHKWDTRLTLTTLTFPNSVFSRLK